MSATFRPEFPTSLAPYKKAQGIVSDDGIIAVMELLQEALPHAIYSSFSRHCSWDWRWLVPKGEYAGTLPKRLQKYFYKSHSFKLSPEVCAKLGDVAKQYVITSDWQVKFSRRCCDSAGWNAGDYGDPDSCFYRENAHIATNYTHADGLSEDSRFHAVLVHDAEGEPFARCLSMYDQERGLVGLFNAYSKNSSLNLAWFARMLSDLWGVSYGQVAIKSNVYVNNAVSYCVGPVDRIPKTASDGLRFTVDIPDPDDDDVCCADCGQVIGEDDQQTNADGDSICERCAENYFYCDNCRETYHNDDYGGEGLCQDCWSEVYEPCQHCGEGVEKDDCRRTIDGDAVCDYCADRHYVVCDCCGNYVKDRIPHGIVSTPSGSVSYCRECAEDGGNEYTICEECDCLVERGHSVCADCACDKMETAIETE